MSQPSVAKAFSDTIVPMLTGAGFTRDGAKRFRRVRGQVCQCLFLHVESRLRREFMIEYCTFLTVVPHTFYPLDHGGRFPVGSHNGTWYRADTDERLAHSVQEVSRHMPALMQWFEATGTIQGYISTYVSIRQGQPTGIAHNGHSAFNLACGHLLDGDKAKALEYAVVARDEFDAIIRRTPITESWAAPCRDRCRDLITCIETAVHHSLLDRWQQVTYDFLKISP